MILMKQNDIFKEITVLLPVDPNIQRVIDAKISEPFNDTVLDFLDKVSKRLFKDNDAKSFPDIITLAFWIRKSNLTKLKKDYLMKKGISTMIGRGIVYHITPSNVAVNFMYSLISSMLAGNKNIVKLAPKNHAQEHILINAIHNALEYPEFSEIKKGLLIIKYGINKDMTDYFSSLCDVRIIWGGDATIAAIRQSPLPPRSTEILFADRYSFSVLDAQAILDCEKLNELALGFYNDTYLMDQNACSSPRLVVWRGDEATVRKVRDMFWNTLHRIVIDQYKLAPIIAVDKYVQLCRDAIERKDIVLKTNSDNFIYRLEVRKLPADVESIRCAGGYFVEARVESLSDMAYIVTKKYQTMAYYGFSKQELSDFVIKNNLRGIDRIVPVGNSLDFGLVWDGYDLIANMSRECVII